MRVSHPNSAADAATCFDTAMSRNAANPTTPWRKYSHPEISHDEGVDTRDS
jgi:hypothetical protein